MRFTPGLRRQIEQRLRRFDVRPITLREQRAAAVTACLLPDEEGRACFLLTRRSSRLRNHGGQWALPGGRQDQGESAEETALRELEEELGVAREQVEVLGRLDDFATRSGYRITPILTWTRGEVEVTPSPDEVAAAYRVPLSDLDAPDVPLLSFIPESEHPVLSMPVLGTHVHAPTAAILYQLLEVAVRGRTTRVAHYEQPRFAWQ
jgi:8-oxo-dGTP pyrophosphatase MutT (NUDIX family)